MDVAMNNGHSAETEAQPEPTDGASVASSEDYGNNNAPSDQASVASQQELTANGLTVSTRPKEQTDRFGFTGGKQFTKDSDWNTPVQVIRRREIKWLDMLDDWDKWMSKKPKKVRERCRKGIPCSIRARAWQYLCGSKKLYEQNKARWKEFDEMEGDPKWLEIIQKDLDRQFPFHEMFAARDGHGQQDLFRILKAYSIYNPRDGYCQAQAPVAAVLLMHMPAEDAFWALVQICEKYLTGYYSVGLEAVQIDGMVLAGLMKKESPITHKHMKKHKIDPILYMTEWFMCIFSRTLPWPSVLRVWDMFFCEGVKVLFRVALVLLKFTLGRSDQIRECQGLYETMEALRNIPESVTNEDFMAAEMLKIHVFDKDMEEEHSLSLARRKVIKERQLAPEKAAAMARDIDILRKKKRGKVKLPPSKDRQEGFGSQDLQACQERETKASVKSQGSARKTAAHPGQLIEPQGPVTTSPEPPRTARALSSASDGHPETIREVHVDNPPKDLNLRGKEVPTRLTSPGAEKPHKSKDSKKEEKKKEKVEKKKGKAQSPTTETASPSHEESRRDKGKEKKKDKDSKKSKKEEKEEKKGRKKHKDKNEHSTSQIPSPIEGPGHEVESPRRMSNGRPEKVGQDGHETGESHLSGEQRLSPYAVVNSPAASETDFQPSTGQRLPPTPPSSPSSRQEQHLASPRQPPRPQDHRDDQTVLPSQGLETPV